MESQRNKTLFIQSGLFICRTTSYSPQNDSPLLSLLEYTWDHADRPLIYLSSSSHIIVSNVFQTDTHNPILLPKADHETPPTQHFAPNGKEDDIQLVAISQVDH